MTALGHGVNRSAQLAALRRSRHIAGMREPIKSALPQGPSASEPDGEPVPRPCDSPGCEATGEHRAPKSRERLRDYYWFCLEHVREYNSAWNYYAGMSETEVEHERRGDTYWHRPTWPFTGERGFNDAIGDRFGLFEDEAADRRAGKEQFAVRAPELAALAVLDLSPPVTRQTIKSRYKELVKRHHPDANGGSKEAEERLKAINRAYETLTRPAAT